MEKSKTQLGNKLTSLEKKMKGKDYAKKVPENVQQADGEKCASLRIEISEMEKAIDGIKNMLNWNISVIGGYRGFYFWVIIVRPFRKKVQKSYFLLIIFLFKRCSSKT